MNSAAVENFLKNIFILRNDEGERSSTTKLATRLGVSGPAVTDMAKKLSQKGLVMYAPYKEIELTPEGLKLAVKVIRRHRIWEMFLHQVLKMDLGEVHIEAEKLEHQTSDSLLKRLDDFLGKPRFDPHGDPIPGVDGRIKKQEGAIKMDQCVEGGYYKIVRLTYGVEEVEQLFGYYFMETGKIFEVLTVFSLDGSMEVVMEGRKVHLSSAIQKRVYCVRVNY